MFSHKKQALLVAWVLLCAPPAVAQIGRLTRGLHYRVEATGAASSGNDAPLWFVANRYGLGANTGANGYLRASIGRPINEDEGRNWRVGYGLDVAALAGMDSKVVLQQLYADVQWKALRLSVGQKERPLEMKNRLLSSGGLTTGVNARPLPQVRLELPHFLTIPGTGGWLAVKAHLAYGAYTDNAWQRHFNAGNTRYLYTAGSLYHSKAGFLRVGNADRFPLSLTGGIEMSCQFGGEAWNLLDRQDHAGEFSSHQDMGHGIRQFWQALIPGGKDSNDGDYHNASGNHLGSWHLGLDYAGEGWSARAYAEHFFDDHSQMFWQFGWKDMLWGVEATLPANPFLGAILYEYLRMDNQSGSVYHDATPNLPIQISSVDDYYNHHVYGAWQHAGHTMGNPLLISPLYNRDNRILCCHNRIRAHHIGLSGSPCAQASWRALYTHERSLGTYLIPLDNPARGHFLLLEATYKPSWCKGLELRAAYGMNGGNLLGKSNGGMLTLAFDGSIRK